jgi:hypothetical protein
VALPGWVDWGERSLADGLSPSVWLPVGSGRPVDCRTARPLCSVLEMDRLL